MPEKEQKKIHKNVFQFWSKIQLCSNSNVFQSWSKIPLYVKNMKMRLYISSGGSFKQLCSEIGKINEIYPAPVAVQLLDIVHEPCPVCDVHHLWKSDKSIAQTQCGEHRISRTQKILNSSPLVYYLGTATDKSLSLGHFIIVCPLFAESITIAKKEQLTLRPV